MVSVLFIFGLVFLVVGARLLVHGASRLAAVVGISPLVVGLTVVAFGTSAPELAVSVGAAVSGRGEIALGNVVGSNILNVLLILGIAAAMLPLVVSRRLVRYEVPLMIVASGVLYGLAFDRTIARGEGTLLIVALALYLGWTYWLSRADNEASVPQVGVVARRWPLYAAAVLAGLLLLVLGANWLVEAAVATARALGVSELVIGLTVVAIGTSLPEAATSVVAAVRGERDIAVGNVVGSNLFNILGVVGLSALAAPAGIAVPAGALSLDIPVMLAAAIACLPVFFTAHRIDRWEGWLFLGYYAAYTAYLVLTATDHAAQEPFGVVMFWFVIPLTVLTLAVLTWRALSARPRVLG